MIEHLYIHIPFCKRKCLYCDFNSFDNKSDKIESYMKALEKELEEYKLKKFKTIYIGGGTPSFIDEKYIIDLLGDLLSTEETTIEVNPCTVTKEKIRAYKEAGINRISMGLQTTNDNILKEIGRAHTFKEFETAYNIIKKEGFENINIDLMFGLPNQTLDILKKSVDYLVDLNPTHISCYSLILHSDIFKSLPNDDEERNMYYYIKDKLRSSGYNHYEISNFAKDGFESKHNLAYWNQKEYIGIGAGASSYIEDIRYKDVSELDKYITGKNIRDVEEVQTDSDKIKEYMILKLRLIKGVSFSEFSSKFNINLSQKFSKELIKLVNLGLIELDDNGVRLTDKGLDFANIVWEEFV